MKNISSTQNTLYKEFKSLKLKKGRDSLGKFIVEGVKNTFEALTSKYEIDSVIISKSFMSNEKNYETIQKLNIELGAACEEMVILIDDFLFDEISDTVSPQGILCVLKKPNIRFNIEKDGFYLILERISDPGNLGTIIRTSEAAGISGIILTKNSVDVYSPKVIRATMGSIFNINVIENCDIIELVKDFKEHEYKIYGAAGNSEKSFWNIGLNKNSAVIIGNESAGLGDEVLSIVDDIIKIPILGKAESLNAGVAASLIVYEYVRFSLL